MTQDVNGHNSKRPLQQRLRPFPPLGLPAQRGGNPLRPATPPRPEGVSGPAAASSAPAQETPTQVVPTQVSRGADLVDTLAELDRRWNIGTGRPTMPPPRPPAKPAAAGPAVADPGVADPTEPTRMPTPAAPRPVQEKGGPGGPSAEALEAVRRSLEQRQSRRQALTVRAEAAGVTPGHGARASARTTDGRTVSQATIDQYRRRGYLLLARYRRELGLGEMAVEDTSPVNLVNWALTLKPGLKSSTWRMYRASLYYFLEGLPSYDTERALALLDADVIDRSRDAPPAPKTTGKKPRKTSALKEKRLPIADYERILTYLRTFCRSKLGVVVADWLRAGLLTGLRPAEWRATDLETVAGAPSPRVYLYVLNAKASNGRGNGVVRVLDISAFGQDDIALIRRMVERGRDWLESGRYQEIQGQCSALLYGVIARIWPHRKYHYSLYSARHQAIANWKSILTPAEIAALVGHGVTATASTHYGRRRSAWHPSQIFVPPKPMQEDLALVQDRMRLFSDRFDRQRLAGIAKGKPREYPLG